MDLALFKQSRGKGKAGATAKSMKPLGQAVQKDGKYTLQHDIVKASVEKKKVKEKDVFDKPSHHQNKKTRPRKKKS